MSNNFDIFISSRLFVNLFAVLCPFFVVIVYLVFLFFFVFILFFFFFFSSRRRHTRCLSDWSSDVCSSDLGQHDRHVCPCHGCPAHVHRPVPGRWRALRHPGAARGLSGPECLADRGGGGDRGRHQTGLLRNHLVHRSEERRVGKECRTRWTE